MPAKRYDFTLTYPVVDFEPSDLSGTRQVITRDKFGKLVSDKNCSLPIAHLAVEVGGSLKIRLAKVLPRRRRVIIETSQPEWKEHRRWI